MQPLPMSEMEFFGGLAVMTALCLAAWLWRTGREHARRNTTPTNYENVRLGTPPPKCASCGTEHSPILPCATVTREDGGGK